MFRQTGILSVIKVQGVSMDQDPKKRGSPQIDQI